MQIYETDPADTAFSENNESSLEEENFYLKDSVSLGEYVVLGPDYENFYCYGMILKFQKAHETSKVKKKISKVTLQVSQATWQGRALIDPIISFTPTFSVVSSITHSRFFHPLTRYVCHAKKDYKLNFNNIDFREFITQHYQDIRENFSSTV